MTAVELQGIGKRYGGEQVLHDVNLSIADETFTVVLGAPGGGKSVLLRLLTGLEKPSAGQILLRGQDVTNRSAGERNIGYVPQSFALYPHYKVYDNIAYPLKLMSVDKDVIQQRVEETAGKLNITHLLEKTPDKLSGGEKQRVAIARGIVKDTDIFVLDDPLIGLDFKLREKLFEDLRQMQVDLNATFVYTTSDPLETLMLASHIAILYDGMIVESGPLEDVYKMPTHLFTMYALGFPKSTVLKGSVERQGPAAVCRTRLFDFPVELTGNGAASDEVEVVVRPGDILLLPEAQPEMVSSQAEIVLLEDLGGELVVYLESDGLSVVSVEQHDDENPLTEGPIVLNVDPRNVVLFEPATGRRIGQGRQQNG